MIRSFLLTLLLPFFSSANGLAVENFTIKQSEVTFKAIGKPGFLRINGESAKVDGTIVKDGSELKGELRCELDKFSTGMDLRDKHMKETYLETKKFPLSILKLTRFPFQTDKTEKFKAMLDLHGVQHEVEGEATVVQNQNKLKIKAEFTIQLSDYAVNIPSYAGIKVADTVTINVEAEAEAKP